jgi:hypothetical protein
MINWKRSITNITVFGLLAAATTHQSSPHAQTPTHPRKHPAKIDIYLGCTADTNDSEKVEFYKSSDADPEVQSTECADNRYSAVGIVPQEVEVEYLKYNDKVRIFLVLGENDAAQLTKITADQFGRRVLIILNGKVLEVSAIAGQFEGTKLNVFEDQSLDVVKSRLQLFYAPTREQ